MMLRTVTRTPLATRLMHTKPARPWATHRLTVGENAGIRPPQHVPEQKPQQQQQQKQAATTPTTEAPVRKRRVLKPRKAAITLTPTAVEHLRALLNGPTPRLIRIGVRNRGCSGLTYNLEYVDRPGKFDEEVVQDDVKVLIDSKALFSVIGSEMDWVDDKLASRFVFNNPNSKGECGCGESFMV